MNNTPSDRLTLQHILLMAEADVTRARAHLLVGPVASGKLSDNSYKMSVTTVAAWYWVGQVTEARLALQFWMERNGFGNGQQASLILLNSRHGAELIYGVANSCLKLIDAMENLAESEE